MPRFATVVRVGLFIPCYIDQFYPNVGLATVQVLEQHNVEVDFPEAQTCCGQPMFNAGSVATARPLAQHFVKTFAAYEYVVAPSASCVSMVRHFYAQLLGDVDAARQLSERTFELCEFLVDVLAVEQVDAHFPHRVGLHQSCHGLRGLRLGPASERQETAPNKVVDLLRSIRGLSLADLERPDECCGFGGTFAVEEPAMSCAMGMDRLADHRAASVDVMTSVDMSCLMHLEGLARRNNNEVRVLHVAEILAGAS